METMEILANEHGLIRQFLDNLTLVGQKLEEGTYPSRACLEKGIEFARLFADKFHHFKEEQVLFVRLAQKKKGEIDSRLEVLRHEHDRGRALVGEIEACLDGFETRDPVIISRLIEKVGAYTALLRHHIHTEDHVFFPMAKSALTADEMELIMIEFNKEREKRGGDTFEKCHKLVVDMGSILTHLQPRR